jgi:hypothetical protein
MIAETIEKKNYWGRCKAGYYLYQFDCLQDFVNLPKPTANEGNKQQWKSYDMNTKSKWLSPNGNTRKEIEGFSKTGWQYGSKKSSEMINDLSLPHIESVKRKRVNSDRGDELDIHQVNRGQISTAWKRTKRLSRKTPKRFTLVCRLGGSCGLSSTELLWRGVTTLALATVLSKAGHAVEIKAFCMNEGVYPNAKIKDRLDIVTVKSFSNPLDIDALSNILCLAGFFRHYVFKAWLQKKYQCPSGLGHMVNKDLQFNNSRQSTVIDIPHNKTSNKQGAEYWLKKTIEAL